MIDLREDYDEEELKEKDLMLIPGIFKKSWSKNRGLRLQQEYVDKETKTQIVAIEKYDYVFKNGIREISDYTRKIEWFDTTGEIITFKDTTPHIDDDHIADVNKVCRNWRMDYLERAAINLADLAVALPEPYKTHYEDVSKSIEQLLAHYEQQIYKYRTRNFLSIELESAILSETNPAIITLLDKFVKIPQTDPKFPDGLTTRQSIMYQLNGGQL